MRTRPQRGVSPAVMIFAITGLTIALSLAPIQVPVALLAVSVLGAISVCEERQRARAARILQVFDILQMKVDDAVAVMRWDRRAFYRALQGEGGSLDKRLEMLPFEFHRVYALLVLRDLGLPELAVTAMKAFPAILDMKRGA